MNTIYYVGLDVHKKTINYCVKQLDGTKLQEDRLPATRLALDGWCKQLPGPWMGALEATMFTEWIYDHLKPQSVDLKVAHSARVKALLAGKKKNDRIDAETLADLLRCNLLPQVHMMPTPLRELRRLLRYRHLLVRQSTQLKNRMAGLLMQGGIEYNKQKLHGQRYFQQLIENLEGVPESVVDLLKMGRQSLEFLKSLEKRLIHSLMDNESLHQRVDLLQSIPSVGLMTALTWALEIGDVKRFPSISQAVSYCGLTSTLRESAGKQRRMPLSRQRNKYLQYMLIEAAKLAPRFYPPLDQLYQREKQKSNPNQATLNVARKLVAYLMAVDRRQRPFEPPSP